MTGTFTFLQKILDLSRSVHSPQLFWLTLDLKQSILATDMKMPTNFDEDLQHMLTVSERIQEEIYVTGLM